MGCKDRLENQSWWLRHNFFVFFQSYRTVLKMKNISMDTLQSPCLIQFTFSNTLCFSYRVSKKRFYRYFWQHYKTFCLLRILDIKKCDQNLIFEKLLEKCWFYCFPNIHKIHQKLNEMYQEIRKIINVEICTKYYNNNTLELFRLQKCIK